jgi:hypothetical protein
MSTGGGVLCLLGEPEDVDLMWLAVALRDRGHKVEVVLPDELLTDSAFSYWIDSSDTAWELTLAGGRTLDPKRVMLVVNRIVTLSPRSRTSTERDSLFVAEEWRAAVVAWMRLLRCPVLNPPRAASLSGPLPSVPEWRSIAHRFGFRCQPWRSDDAPIQRPSNVLCIGNRVIDQDGVLPQGMDAAVTAMARYVGTPLLGLTYDPTTEGPIFLNADPFPSLLTAGSAVVEAVEHVALEVVQ